MAFRQLRNSEETTSGPPESPEWSLVLRVANSRGFQKAPRLRELLQYLCQCSLEGRTDDLHEQKVGCHVFGRTDSYRTQDDNIVRVSVSQLRKKLDLYFSGEGAAEPVVIEIPRGTYQPQFCVRGVADFPVATPENISAALARSSRLPWAIGLILGGVIIVLLATVFGLWRENRIHLAEAHPLNSLPAPVQHFWRTLFNPNHRTDIVVADSGLAFLQDITGGTVFLDDFAAGRHIGRLLATPKGAQLEAIVRRMTSREFTSAADIQLALKITNLNRIEWQRGSVRFARSLETRDFNSQNMILLGSKRSNPWVELFEPRMNFRLEYDNEVGAPKVRNLSPQPGEEAVYRSDLGAGPQTAVFAVIGLLPNLGTSGHVLLIAGTDMEATEAAGNYLCGPFSAPFLARLGFGQASKPPHFEAVIKAIRAGEVGVNPKVVAYRTVDMAGN
jgi:hypothetical protein